MEAILTTTATTTGLFLLPLRRHSRWTGCRVHSELPEQPRTQNRGEHGEYRSRQRRGLRQRNRQLGQAVSANQPGRRLRVACSTWRTGASDTCAASNPATKRACWRAIPARRATPIGRGHFALQSQRGPSHAALGRAALCGRLQQPAHSAIHPAVGAGLPAGKVPTR
jgi:hypothetical protein